MPSNKKLLQAAAGNAGGTLGYVEDVFSTYLYTGTNAARDIVNGIDLDGEGGLVWLKRRNTTGDHSLYDTERGVGQYLKSNSTSSQDLAPSGQGLTAFNSDGFSLGTDWNQDNSNGDTFASWTFRKAEKFFDVVTYTGDGVAGRTVAHNLGSVPACIIIKCTSASQSWVVYHTSLGATKYLTLNTTNAFGTTAVTFNDTAPTDSVFSVGTAGSVNGSGSTYVAYLFASDAGGFGDDGSENIIKCGSYTTDGSASAQHIDLGFEPQFFIKKKVTGADNWEIYDTMRGWSAPNDTYGVSSANRLYTNLNVAEGATTSSPGPTATGMYFPDGGQSTNATYIYIAIRRPMKTPESGTEVFLASTVAASVQIATGFNVDLWINGSRDGSAGINAQLTMDRMRGAKYLRTTQTTADTGTNNPFTTGPSNTFTNNVQGGAGVAWMFKRATGFFDVVAYTGDSVAGRTVSHNLGVAPELMVVKARSDAAASWSVYSEPLGNTKFLRLNSTNASSTSSSMWNNTSPTADVFTLGTDGDVNWSGSPDYIAYLFASLAGVSKVGSYTGTGSDLNVDCGFSAGARFILIKRTDATGDWYVWDSVRGITAGNDPYLLLNSTAAEVTSTDYIDPLSSGFTVTSSAPAALNASGGTYIFLAIA